MSDNVYIGIFHQYPLEVVQMVDFPEELVVNTNVELAKSFLNYFKSPKQL